MTPGAGAPDDRSLMGGVRAVRILVGMESSSDFGKYVATVSTVPPFTAQAFASAEHRRLPPAGVLRLPATPAGQAGVLLLMGAQGSLRTGLVDQLREALSAGADWLESCAGDTAAMFEDVRTARLLAGASADGTWRPTATHTIPSDLPGLTVLRRVADAVSTLAAQLQGLLVTGSLTAGPGGYASADLDPRLRLEGTPYGRLMLLVLQAAEQTALRLTDGLEGFHRPLAVAYMLQSTLVPLGSDAVGTVENRLKDLTGHGMTPSQMFAATAARPAWLPTGVLGSGGLSSG